MSDAMNLDQRLRLLKMDKAARSRLADARPVIEAALQPSLEAFYAQVRATPDVARFFGAESQIAGAKDAQARHWGLLASGAFDPAYVEGVRRIGQTHARIGLEPRWYIGGYALVLEGLIEAIVTSHAKTRSLFSKRDDGKALSGTLASVVKAAMLDMDFVISLYLEAAETKRLEADQKRAQAEAEQTRVVEDTAAALAALAQGDLRTRIASDFTGGYARLKTDFNTAMQRLDDAMAEIARQYGRHATGRRRNQRSGRRPVAAHRASGGDAGGNGGRAGRDHRYGEAGGRRRQSRRRGRRNLSPIRRAVARGGQPRR